MPLIKRLLSKKNLHVIGMMSGTSLDGLDLAYCRIFSQRTRYMVKILNTACYRFPDGLRGRLYTLASENKASKESIKWTDIELSKFYSAKVKRFISGHGIKSVDLIGCHGQTIYHHDQRLTKSGKGTSLTWQIGDGAFLAANTGIPVVSDFRPNDIALGGSGAPLMPICHYHIFGNNELDTAVLNIGGITNLTFLPKKGGKKNIQASDCGPGNMLVDQLMQILYGSKFDRGGKVALSGRISKRLLINLKRHAWFKKPFPKSLGREQFGIEAAKYIIDWGTKYRIPKADLITTASEMTVQAVLRYIENFCLPDRLVVCGGGERNRYFISRLKDLLPSCGVLSSREADIDPDYVEAAGFALLGAMWIFNGCANLPSVTGASRETILGKLTLP